MTDNNIITVTEFGLLAREVDTTKFSSPTISGMISQASKQVSDYLEYTPFAEDIANEMKPGMVTTEGDLLIFPAKPPVISVSTIAIVKGTTSVSLTLQAEGVDRFNIDYTKRNVRYPYHELSTSGPSVLGDFFSLRGQHFYTKMSYRGGWEVSEMPAVIKQATILYMKDLLYAQFNTMGLTRLRQGNIEFGFGNMNKSGKSAAITAAEKLLNPYRRVG